MVFPPHLQKQGRGETVEYQIAIYSADDAFARMLELEFSMLGVRVCRVGGGNCHADVVLLDLDSAAPPKAGSFGKMIGFTRQSATIDDEWRRQCSLVLHRPFEMRLLRREILSELGGGVPVASAVSEAADPALLAKRITLDKAASCLRLDRESVALTPSELLVAECLLSHRGDAVSREELAGVLGETSSNKVDVYVCYLRKKLERLTSVKLIRTVRNRGYLLL